MEAVACSPYAGQMRLGSRLADKRYSGNRRRASSGRLPVIAATVLLGACGSKSTTSTPECDWTELPDVLMTTLAGEQVGELSGSCLEKAGCGATSCIDSGAKPRTFTVARPGDEVLISVRNGTLVEGERCTPKCPPTLRVQQLGCGEFAGEHQELIDGQPWVVDLAPGSYWLWVYSHFVSRDGWSGQIAAGFGLTVDSDRDRTVARGITPDAGCGTQDGGAGAN